MDVPSRPEPAAYGDGPQVSVVVATRDRAARLEALLRSLERQTVGPGAFEVVVVDDASRDGTADLLQAAAARGGLRLTVVRQERSRGPAAARNSGWRAARAPLVAFTDDDCEADQRWLEIALEAWRARPDAIVQGATEPIARETHRRSPFMRTIVVDEPGPPWETCNIFYPRALLERLQGFEESFPLPGGEDTDLAWRAVRGGVAVQWVPQARVSHAVIAAGPVGNLRYAWHWNQTVPLFARHPDLRRRQLHRGVFWSPTHEHLLRALVALALPRRLWPVALWLAWPYLRRLAWRRSGPLLAPYLALYDAVEMAGILRGALRDRVPVI